MSGAAVLAWTCHSLDLSSIRYLLSQPTIAPSVSRALALPGTLIALAALIKSAVFPFHNWLFRTLESPTPFSAFLHAGLVNIAGFLSFRLMPILCQFPGATLMTGFGLLSAILGAVLSLVQPDVKRKLVFSTVAQMGFMCLQCSIGALPSALLHLTGHGFFKCYLFLNASTLSKETFSSSRQFGIDTALKVGITACAALLIMFALKVSPLWLSVSLLVLSIGLEYLCSKKAADVSPHDLIRNIAMPAFVFVAGYAAFYWTVSSEFMSRQEYGGTSNLLFVLPGVMLFIWSWLHLSGDSDLKNRLYVFALNGAYLTQFFDKSSTSREKAVNE
jgi:NADH:ubiquinone oxidoreductase subunit 5 (subunit L)/multisubunit Na+/H+ antiporter MnhA subunit